jgi:pilus assembly protein CpaB
MKLLGFIVALIFAVIFFFVALEIMDDKKEKGAVVVSSDAPDVETVSVLVASRKIDLGDVISSDMIDVKRWPKAHVIDGFVTDEQQSKAVVGFVSRSVFMPGEPLSMNRISNPEDPSFIAANLPEGMRMVTVSSDAIAGLAGFLAPGDRVDVVVTRDVDYPKELAEEKGEDAAPVSETLLTNIKVLAVNQAATLVQETKDDNQSRNNAEDKLPKSVSLEVTLEQSQQLRLGQEVGELSLVLRSLEDKEVETLPVVTMLKNITGTTELEEFKQPKKKFDVIGIIRGTERTDIEIPIKIEEQELEQDQEETMQQGQISE